MKAIGDDLDKRQPPQLADDIDQDMSLKEIVTSLAPRLLNMKRRGFTTDGMVAVLKESKINIDGKTLNRYLNTYKATGKKPVSDAAAKPKRVKSSRKKDGSTPGEETLSEQPDHAVEINPTLPEDCFTPEDDTPSVQPSHPVSTLANSIPDQLKDLI